MPRPTRPVVIVHGYSDRGKSASEWCRRLTAAGYDVSDIHVADYLTLTNEVTIKDIAEAFDRAVRLKANLNVDQPFDAIVHSTGMLVIRAWLTTYQARRRRLKHLIGLAPATFGSPLASQGRSLLGAVFKGNYEFGPDFMEQGKLVLSQLELASPFTWQLAHQDLLAQTQPVYGPDADTPYAFIFVGLKNYGQIKSLLTESKGTDGTVRWAGVGFNCRKITMDLSIDPASEKKERIVYEPWANTTVPLVLLPQHNHGSIFGKPDDDVAARVIDALRVESLADYDAWKQKHETPVALDEGQRWQQFITHVVDERGDGVEDYYVDLFTYDGTKWILLNDFAPDVHTNGDDPSFRCFHVELTPFLATRSEGPQLKNLWLRLIASSGTKLVSYYGHNSERVDENGMPRLDAGKWDAVLDLSAHLQHTSDGKQVNLFYPLTTTLVEIRLNREPMPLGVTNEADLLKLLAPPT